MVDIIVKVLLIMAVLFVFAVPGFVLRKTKLVSSESLSSISNILLCFAQPMLIIKAFAVDPVPPHGRDAPELFMGAPFLVRGALFDVLCK